ncbi:MAG: hypothetical protein R3Y36_09115 [Spirochaetales bacterium]
MKYAKAIALLCLFVVSSLHAQETETPVIQTEQETITYKMNQKGDQFIALKLDVNIPYRPFENLKVGGSGSLGYHHFLTSEFTIGGNVSFAYTTTIGSNVFYFVPFMFTASYQFTAGKFEIPISLEIGGALQNYLDRTYFGLAVRPEIAAYYRYSPDWSFGIQTGVYILPQWYSNSEYNYTGIIQDVGLSVRYHF